MVKHLLSVVSRAPEVPSICFALQFDLPVHRVVAYLSNGDVFNLTCVLQDARPSFREPVSLLGAPETPSCFVAHNQK